MTFTCKVSGEPQPEVVWLHNGQPVGVGERYIVTQNVEMQQYSLQVASVTVTDSGTYEVTASNEFGKVSCHATLEVEGNS